MSTNNLYRWENCSSFFIEIRKQEFNLATTGTRQEAMRLIGKRPSLYSENKIQLIATLTLSEKPPSPISRGL